MLISKNTESCRLNIVCQLAAAAAGGGTAAGVLISPSKPPSLLWQAAEFWPTVLWLHYHAVSQ